MKFSIEDSIQLLERTPLLLQNLLQGLPDNFTLSNEGPETWSAFDVVGHLIQGEIADWLPRVNIILSANQDKGFKPFDRFAQFNTSKGKTLTQLLLEFKELRTVNLASLRELNISGDDLEKQGVHPTFGPVTLSQLLSTWVVHDLDHVYQIVRVMAKQYREEVGPWIAFLKVLKQ